MTTPRDSESTLRLLQDAIRADVHARVDLVMGRLEDQITGIEAATELERALEQALADVADAMAEGIVAQLREARRLERGG
jgi:hypothetical protein